MDAFNLLLEMKLKRRRERPDLPRTVTELVAEDGSRVYVVGTAHFSDDSKRDVVKVRPPLPGFTCRAVPRPSRGWGRRGAGASGAGLWAGRGPELACPPQTIREVQPDVVVVELCQYRVSMLKMDERTLLREAKEISLEKLQQAIRQVRPSGGPGPGLCPRGRRRAGWRPTPEAGAALVPGTPGVLAGRRGGEGASVCPGAAGRDPHCVSLPGDIAPKGDVDRGVGFGLEG